MARIPQRRTLRDQPKCGWLTTSPPVMINKSKNLPWKHWNFLASLSNRALLVNNLFDVALYAGSRVVSAVGTKPPHDGRSRVRPPKVLRAVRIGRNEATRMALPTSRQGHRDSTSEECTNMVSSTYGVTALSVGLNCVPDFHMARRTTAILR